MTEAIEKVADNPVERAKQALEAWQALTSEAAVQQMERLPVTNDDEEAFAARLLQEIKAQWHVLEEQRTNITGPMNKALRATNELFRPASKTLEKHELILKRKIAEYMDSKQAANVAALQTAASASSAEQAMTAIALTAPVEPPAGVSRRKVWKFAVDDPDAVPRELCSPDMAKIGAALSAGQVVPGVRVYEESIVSVRQT